jgi:hypothetical protein
MNSIRFVVLLTLSGILAAHTVGAQENPAPGASAPADAAREMKELLSSPEAVAVARFLNGANLTCAGQIPGSFSKCATHLVKHGRTSTRDRMPGFGLLTGVHLSSDVTAFELRAEPLEAVGQQATFDDEGTYLWDVTGDNFLVGGAWGLPQLQFFVGSGFAVHREPKPGTDSTDGMNFTRKYSSRLTYGINIPVLSALKTMSGAAKGDGGGKQQ